MRGRRSPLRTAVALALAILVPVTFAGLITWAQSPAGGTARAITATAAVVDADEGATVTAGDGRYELEHEDGSVAARHTSVVRGIALKTEELGLEQWIDSLAAEVMAEAARSERGRLALEDLLIGNASEEAT